MIVSWACGQVPILIFVSSANQINKYVNNWKNIYIKLTHINLRHPKTLAIYENFEGEIFFKINQRYPFKISLQF